MMPSVQKRCSKCLQLYDAEAFFRQDLTGVHARRKLCIGCERSTQDRVKQQNRWPEKVRLTTRHHAARYGIAIDALVTQYGWNPLRMANDAEHAYANGCPYCAGKFADMGHGLQDISLDIIDRDRPPFYLVNTRWVCRTCNTQKARTAPELWARKQLAWEKWRHRPLLPPEPTQLGLWHDQD